MTTGTITGTITTGVTLTSASYWNPITISSGASITGVGSGVNAVYGPTGTSWTVDNQGTVSGGNYNGVNLDGGAVINEANATITGGPYGVFIANGTVENAGTIGGVVGLAGGVGVYVGGSSAFVDNSGTITGNNDFGARLGGTQATLHNSGLIAGGAYAVFLDADTANRLILDASAAFSGAVQANASAANTIELTSGASVGTLSGLGTHYQYFQTLTIDSGASWDVAGSLSGFQGVTVAGFTNDDKLDLTDVTFNAGDRADFNSATDVLTIRNSGGSEIGTIQLSADFSGDFFHLLDDGNGGTFVEDNETPCFCRGTMIRIPSNEIAIEDLRIGDCVTTADGAALSVRWIGRRSYRDWQAIGNADVQPICFKAGSLADRVPARDLYVSPEHALFLDGMLVPAGRLVNGVSVLKMEGMEEIDYFHIELERHAVIFAEGAATESFADDGSRDTFNNARDYRALYPDEPRRRFVQYCAPRLEDGYQLDVLRRTLATRGARLLPNRKAARTPVQQGYLDRATRTMVEGWAIPPSGHEAVLLAIVVNGAVVGQTHADCYRGDLKDAGFRDGYCSFHFVLPQPLSPGLSHRIEVRRESDWTLLHGGPVTLHPAVTRAAA